jgi:hypothetical protein
MLDGIFVCGLCVFARNPKSLLQNPRDDACRFFFAAFASLREIRPDARFRFVSKTRLRVFNNFLGSFRIFCLKGPHGKNGGAENESIYVFEAVGVREKPTTPQSR